MLFIKAMQSIALMLLVIALKWYRTKYLDNICLNEDLPFY
jgi:hypothetical protein